jgi:hypothetical protein
VTMTVLVEATDGLRAGLSLAELDPELTDRVILLADIKDGQRLPRREGAFHIIVPTDKRPDALGSRGQGGDTSQKLKAVPSSCLTLLPRSTSIRRSLSLHHADLWFVAGRHR